MKKYLILLTLFYSLTGEAQTVRQYLGLKGLIYNDTLITAPRTTLKYLTGYNTFGSFNDSARAAISLTTTGTSGAATYSGGVLNVPQYSGGGGSMAIGSAVTSATAGSIFYAGTGGILQQSNTKFFFDSANKRLGIGTGSPSYIIHTTENVAGVSRFFAQNTNSGNLAQTIYEVDNDAGEATQMGKTGSTFTTSGLMTAGTSFLQANHGPLLIRAISTNSPGNIIFAVQTNLGTTEAARIFNNGTVGINNSTDSSAKLMILGSGNTLRLRNTTNTSYTSARFYNDQNTAARALEIGYSGSAFSGSIVTGSPAGEVGFIATGDVFPLVFGTNNTTRMYITSTGSIVFPATNTATGTTGAQTINKPSGKVNFAAAATTLVVTNSLVTTASIVRVQVEGTDATATSARVTLAAGSFTITLNAAATAETKVAFEVIN